MDESSIHVEPSPVHRLPPSKVKSGVGINLRYLHHSEEADGGVGVKGRAAAAKPATSQSDKPSFLLRVERRPIEVQNGLAPPNSETARERLATLATLVHLLHGFKVVA
jgi:hypothetical protein